VQWRRSETYVGANEFDVACLAVSIVNFIAVILFLLVVFPRCCFEARASAVAIYMCKRSTLEPAATRSTGTLCNKSPKQ